MKVVFYIMVPLRVLFIAMPYYSGDPKRDLL